MQEGEVMHIERAENVHSGHKLLMVHYHDGPDLKDTLYADLTTGEVGWRFKRGLLASCTSPEATEAAFMLMASK
jgi:hypothetical protein